MSAFFKGRKEETKILFIYRYVSLIITSIFYSINEIEHTNTKKIFIIFCLSTAAIILSYLYIICENSKKNIKILLFIETISNSILLIPSGGLNSPFIWYTLNTILISSLFLKREFIWINIFLYLILTTCISHFAYNYNLNLLNFLKHQSNLILSMIMIIISIYLTSIYINQTKGKNKELEELNAELKTANQMITVSFDHIKALYQSLSIFSNQGNVEGIINKLFAYIKDVTKTDAVFFYDMKDEEYELLSKGIEKDKKLIEDEIINNLKEILESKNPGEISVQNVRYVIVPVGNNYLYYGVLGFEVTNEKEGLVYQNNLQQVKFLSELTSITLERINMEEINDRLLISEEQNRIANEIHDSVLQRLFGMSCGVFSLIKRLDNCSTVEITEELNQFRETTDMVMKELRDKIYGLSWKKSGQNSFVKDIKRYIEEIKRFNNMNIPFTITGNIELLSNNQKRALYRIICEALGNAVRHGKAENVEINLCINSEFASLNVKDDGMGFDTHLIDAERSKGLGIHNMVQLAESLKGDIEIQSKIGSGTIIDLTVPTDTLVLRKGESKP
ncbi:ATP-binding protein [Tissierellaceae bacterium BX21]|uniref:histidine kinase n=2 Tax=Paratissierella segnis TaxID=2763679 RepID=A0A926EVM3_9FIRM|nr:ATP-binding protein [Paratissierella segnis]